MLYYNQEVRTMTTVQQVVIDHNFPEDVVILTGCQDDFVYWEDVAEEEVICSSYYNGTLEIEID